MFRYASFWRAFRELGSPADDVVCNEYIPDYQAIKYHSSTGQQQVFKHRGMTARRLDPDDPLVISQHPRYQHGAYVVFPRNNTTTEEEQAKRRKALYIVDLTRHFLVDDVINESRTFFTADHFSFIVNDNDKTGNKLHLHRTEYRPKTFEKGNVDHTPGHIPLEFPLERPEDLHSRLGFLAFKTRWVYSILKRPEGLPSLQSSPSSTGGAGRRRRSRRHNRQVASFDDIFINLPVDRLLVFGIPRLGPGSNTMDVTVFVRRRAPHMSRGQNDICFAFEMETANVADEFRLRQRIAQAFIGVQPGDYADKL